MKYNLNKKAYHDIITDPWVKKLIEQRGLNARSENMFKMFDENKSLIDEHIEQLLNILWWSQPWNKLKRWSLNKLRNYLNLKTQVSAYKYIYKTNESRFFRRTILFNDIFTKKEGSRHGICVMRNCPPGYEPQKAIFYDATWQIVFDWRCIKCRDKHIKPSKHNEPCKICPQYFVPNKNRSACFDPYNDLYLRPFDTTAIIGIVINLIGVCANLTILVIFIKYSATPVVRSSNVNSSIAHLCGHICLFLVLPVVFIGKPTLTKCIFRPFVIGCLLTFVASLSFTKVQRLLFIFRAKIHLSSNRVRLSKAVEIFIITLLLIIQVTTFVISYVHKIPKLQSIRNIHGLTRVTKCNTESHLNIQLLYVVILFFICTVLGIRARNLPKHFKETNCIAFSMFTTVIVLLLKFPLYYSNIDKIIINFLTISIVNIVQLFILYGYKAYIILFCSNKNTKQHLRTETMRVTSMTVVKYRNSVDTNCT